MPKRALEGLRVVELGEFVAAPYCTKLLSDLGAEVIKIERPGKGDEARFRGPFPDDIPHAERSGLFLYLNTNKLGVTLDVATHTGKKIFRNLIRHADVLVEDRPVGLMRELGLDFQALSGINSRLVVTSITPFGEHGCHSRYKAYYLNTFHGGGEGYTLPGGLGWLLYSDRAPIRAGGFVGEYNCGVAAALATLGAIHGRREEGLGQHVEISKQEVLLTLMRLDISKFNDGWIESRATRSVPIGGFVECKDGFVQLIPLWAHMWKGLVEAMGNPEWASQPRFEHARLVAGWQGVQPVSDEVMRDREIVNAFIAEWALQRNADEICDSVQAKGCIATKVNTARDLLNSDQLRTRGFFVVQDHPEAGKIVQPGTPYKFSETPPTVESPAPLMGQHNEDIYCRRLGYSKEELVKLRQGGIV